ncbi:MAG TPA: 30S ribosomal protein S21 [Gemmatimonadales bacterium]|nr:30S ribosomal protein S21 [Gemmatimonadales bacterium]
MEIVLGEDDRLDVALKAFRRKMAKAGILREIRRRRYYLKPSVAKAVKAAEAKRRRRRQASREH